VRRPSATAIKRIGSHYENQRGEHHGERTASRELPGKPAAAEAAKHAASNEHGRKRPVDKPGQGILNAVVSPNAVTATRLVPTAFIIGMRMEVTSSGTIRKPPPIPKSPRRLPFQGRKSYSCRPFLLGAGPMFAMTAPLPGSTWDLFASAALGIVVGIEAMLISTSLYRVEDLFHKLPLHWMWWPAIGAIAVGLGGLVDARVLGAGCASIDALLNGSLALKMVVSLLVIKALVWLIALGSGTSGGVLAPLLILGGAAGFLQGQFLPGNPSFWAMIGLAGIMSGAMRAPLTGALFAVELTRHFEAIPCTIATAAGAYAVSLLFMRRSILTEKIARRGRHVLQEYTVDPLDLLQAGQIMTHAAETLPACMTTAQAVTFFAEEARHRSYPVVDADNRLVGIVSRSDALRWQTTAGTKDVSLGETISDADLPVAFPETPVGRVADLIIETGIGRIPIVDQSSRMVVGLLSRQDLLKVRSESRMAEIGRSRFA